MMSEHSHKILGFLLLGWAGPAFGADLETTLRHAAASGPDVLIARYDAEIGRASGASARAPALPRVGASAGWTWNQVPAEFVIPGTTDKVVIVPENQLDASLRVDVPVFAPATWARASAGAQGAEAAYWRSIGQVDTALLAVARAWADARATARAAEVAQGALSAAEAALAQSQARKQAGLASLLDVRRDEAEVARTRQIVANAEADRELAARRLIRLSGLQEVATAGQARPAPTETDVERAVSSHPDVQMARAELAQARRNWVAERAGLVPEVGAFAQVRATNATGFGGEPLFASGGATLSWDLWDGGGMAAAGRQARARLEQATARTERIEQEVRDAVIDAASRWKAAQLGAEAARARVEAARESQTLTAAEVEAGRLTAVDGWNARRDLLDAELAFARSEADLAVSLEQYRLTLGQRLVEGT
jgi:outer membrane protein TolC